MFKTFIGFPNRTTFNDLGYNHIGMHVSYIFSVYDKNSVYREQSSRAEFPFSHFFITRNSTDAREFSNWGMVYLWLIPFPANKFNFSPSSKVTFFPTFSEINKVISVWDHKNSKKITDFTLK